MIKKILMVFVLSAIIAGCASSPKIMRILPAEEVANMMIEDVIKDEKLSVEEKSSIIRMKMLDELERKKKAVETEKDNRLAAIINRPISPLRTPDTILRVLMLPYEDNNGILNSWKYSFIKVDDGKWVIADYLNGSNTNTKKNLTPLK